MKSNNFFICVLMAALAASITWNTDILKPTTVKADAPALPQISFAPVGKFNLDVNLETGTASVESNLRISEANVTVNHPAKAAEQSSVKPKIIKVPVYETKTEYLTKIVTFPLPKTKLHVPSISIPNRVE